MNNTYPQKTSLKCHICGSFLLLIGQETEIVPGQYSPVITSVYNCSNADCQRDFDKQTAKRVKIQAEQDLAREKRIENNKQSRKLANTLRKS